MSRASPNSAETVPTHFVDIGTVRLAYRRFGNPAGIPLVFPQHFRGSMDNRDPALLNCLAKDRTVISFDNAGVGFYNGEVPDTVAAMAQCAVNFLDALGLTLVDLLGFSLGGYIAHYLALNHHQFGEGDYEEAERVIQQLLAEAGDESAGQDLVTLDARGPEVAAA